METEKSIEYVKGYRDASETMNNMIENAVKILYTF